MMAVIINGIEYLPASAVAEQLATTQLKVLMLLKEKVLSGEMIDGEWYVTTGSLACYDAHAQDPVKQEGCRTSCTSKGCGCR
jgi:hypothetical protein